MPDEDASPLRLIERLKRASEAVAAGLDAYVAQYGLTAPDFEIVAALRRAGRPYRLTQRQLGASVVRTPGTITARVDRLVAAGLVERRPHPDDRRVAYVHLTRRGRTVYDQLADGYRARGQALLRSLRRSDRRVLARLLACLLDGLHEVDVPRPAS